MKSSRFWVAIAAAGVAVSILDFLVQGMWLTDAIYSKMPEIFNTAANPAWYIFGDFVAVFVLAWVYSRVEKSFESSMKGGATYGLYAGILVNFPTWIFLHLFIRGFPYSLSWISTIYGIIWTIFAGAIIGAIYKKGSTSPA